MCAWKHSNEHPADPRRDAFCPFFRRRHSLPARGTGRVSVSEADLAGHGTSSQICTVWMSAWVRTIHASMTAGLREHTVHLVPAHGRHPDATRRQRGHAGHAWRTDHHVRPAYAVCLHTHLRDSRSSSQFPLFCRNAIRAQLIAKGVIGQNAYVVIAGPANTYAHYVATKEEYSVQRYEGASTIFGQCQL